MRYCAAAAAYLRYSRPHAAEAHIFCHNDQGDGYTLGTNAKCVLRKCCLVSVQTQ